MTASWREVVRPTLRVARTGRADLIAGERAVQDVGKLVVGPARQVPKNAACAGVYGVWSNDIGGIAPWTLENQQIARAEPHPAQGSDRLIGRHVTEDLTEQGLVISGQASVRARGSGLPRFVPGSFPRRGHPEILPRLYSLG